MMARLLLCCLCCLCWMLGIGLARAAGPDAAAAPGETQILVMLPLPPAHFRPGNSYAGAYGDGFGRIDRRRRAADIARQHGLTLLDAWPMPLLGVECYVMRVPAGQASEPILQRLAQDRRIEWAQALQHFHARQQDPLFPAQPAAGAWHLAELQRHASGRQVRIAVIDSGIDQHHPDLRGQVVFSENFGATPWAAEQHGTAVAAIIAARADNAQGIAGVAPRARLLALRACWQQGDGDTRCNSLTLAQALQAAIEQQAQVINLSLSGPSDRLLHKWLDLAVTQSITVVGAYDAQAGDGGFPASHPGVVAVSDHPVAASQVWVAPGQDVPTAGPGGRWRLVSGSSYATAHVSGLFGLLHELHPAPLPGSPAEALVAQRPAAGAARSRHIDACASLSRISGHCICGCNMAGIKQVQR